MSNSPQTPQEEKPNPAIWGEDGNGAQQVSQGSEQGGLLDTIQHYWRAADTSIFDHGRDITGQAGSVPVNIHVAGLAQKIQAETQKQQDVINYEVDHNNPIRASIAEYYYGALDAATDLAMAVSSPKQLAFMAVAPAAKAAGMLKSATAALTASQIANLYFWWRGAQQALTPPPQSETTPETVSRILGGAGQALLSAVGVKEGASAIKQTMGEVIHPIIQKQLGLSGDLASRVQAEVAKADSIQSVADKQIETLTAATKAQVASTEQIAQGIHDSLSQEMAAKSDAIVGEAAKAVVMEQSRVEAVFEDALRRSTGPVTNAADLKTEISNTLEAHGLQDKEIPRSIFNAIPSDTTTVRALTASELKASQMARKLVASGMGNSEVRASLVNLGYVPKQIDAIMNVAGVPAKSEMSFGDVIRVKNDLWSAANSATDPKIRTALFEAQANLDGLLQRTANDQGFGPTFKNANQQYATFKRELGVGQMADFVNASNVSEQTTLDRMSKLLSPKQGETLLKLMKVAGVDVGGLQGLAADQEATAEAAKGTVKSIQQGAKADISQVQKDANAEISNIGKDSQIIPGKSNLDMAEMNTAEIRRQALRTLATRARAAGITNPMGFIQVTIGFLRMAAGSSMGTFQVASGASKMGIRALLQKPSFQNWIMQESGVTPSAAPSFRQMLSGNSEIFSALAQSSVPERAADTVIHAPAPQPVAPAPPKTNQVRTLTPQPSAPIKPQGNIRIAP